MRLFLKITLTLCFYSSAHAGKLEIQQDEWDGKHYRLNSELQYQWATSYFQKLKLNGNEKVLDIGCGDGRITATLASFLPNGFVVGVDTSESMLQVARDLKNKIQLFNLDFVNEMSSI